MTVLFGEMTHQKRGRILSTSEDRNIKEDLQQKQSFPLEIVATTMRSDILLRSRKTRTIRLIVPRESKRKKQKYHLLVEEYSNKKWKTWNLPFKVSTSGFVCLSTRRALGLLGTIGAERREVCRKLEETDERTSRWICREQQWRFLARPDQSGRLTLYRM